MKTTLVPNCDRQLITGGLCTGGLRIDGRKKDEYRVMEIVFGNKFGSCLVSLGNTRVLTTITAELSEPRPARPNEGTLKVSVDLSPMACCKWEGNRQTEDSVEISRVLERSIKEAKCLDLESLCLISGKKAWALEANIIVFNTEGNLVESCSISLLASLCHFKRNDVTVSQDGSLIVHDFDDRHPIPLTVFHYPFCTKFCFFEGTQYIVVDPSEIEEEVCDGYIIVGANAHRELTAIHISGRSKIDKEVILKCCHRSIERTKRLTETLRRALTQDKERREGNKRLGFGNYIREHGPALLGCTQVMEEVKYEEDEEAVIMEEEAVENTKAFRFMKHNQQQREDAEEEEEVDQYQSIGQGGSSRWEFEPCNSREPNDAMDTIQVSSGDESEEEVQLMESSEFKVLKKKKR